MRGAVIAIWLASSVAADPHPASGESVRLAATLSGDRTRPFRTKLPVNQGYLNQISAPPDAAVLTPMFEELAQLERAASCLPGRSREDLDKCGGGCDIVTAVETFIAAL